MYKIFRHKKGIGIDDLLPLLFTIIVFVLIMAFLNINDINRKKEMNVDIKVRLGSIKAEHELLNLLETEVEIDKKNMTMADLIRLYYYEKRHKDVLVTEIEKMLNSLSKPPAIAGWNLNIHIMPEDEEIIKIETYQVVGWYEKKSLITYLPLANNPEKYLKLKLWLECQC